MTNERSWRGSVVVCGLPESAVCVYRKRGVMWQTNEKDKSRGVKCESRRSDDTVCVFTMNG